MMHALPINTLDEAIDAALAFYGVSEAQAARRRTDIDFTGVPAPLMKIYDRLGGILDASLDVSGYGPFRAGCMDLEYPFIDPKLGFMIMTDSQNGPMYRLSDDKTKIECVGHGPEYHWEGPLEAFLIDWLIDDWVYRLRWGLSFPPKLSFQRDDKGVKAFNKLKPQMVKLFTSSILSNRTFYALGDMLVIHDVWGANKEHEKFEFGAFLKPKGLPKGAVLTKTQWHDETLAQWETAVKAL